MYIYEKYHSKRRLEKRVISDHDYTHRPLLSMIDADNYMHKKVLDIGCGTGTICFYFASKGSRVYGIDISKNAIKMARINSKNLGLASDVSFSVIDFPNQKIKGKYDLIICSELLEHIDDHNKALREISKLLAKKGSVVFSVPLNTSFLYKHNFLDKFEVEVGHLRRYDEKSFIKVVKDNGFKIIGYRKNQGILRDYLFTSTTRSILVGLANRFKFISDLLTVVDQSLFFLGVSNMVVLAQKK